MYPPKLIKLCCCSALLLFLFIINSGCEKHVKQGNIQPGIALTFDDNYIDNWYNHLGMLDSFGAKATFYISNYSRLTSAQKLKLKVIQQRGHEIAFHTTTHAHLVRYLQDHSMKELLQKEIYAGLDSMAKDGFYPKNFAYPYGRHNPHLDSTLLRIFSSIRSLNGTKDYTKSVCKTYGNKHLKSLTLDNDGLPTSEVLTMIKCASENDNCVVFLAHKINNGKWLEVSPDRLRQVLTKARDLKLRFYTVKELAR